MLMPMWTGFYEAKEGDTKAKSFLLDYTLNIQNTGTIDICLDQS